MGCSTHSVPSWSKVAIRSSGGTNFELAWSVVARTKSRIARLAGPSFHELNESPGGTCVWASAGWETLANVGSHARPKSSPRRLIAYSELLDFIFNLQQFGARRPFTLENYCDHRVRISTERL